MKSYKLYFDFYGKKMQTTVQADSIAEAKKIVIKNINFLKVVPEDNHFDFLKSIFGI
jgi:hypothetical protein